MDKYSLATKRLRLELVDEPTVDEYFASINTPDVLATMGSLHYPLNEMEVKPVFMMENDCGDFHWAVFEKESNKLIGGCSLLDFNRVREHCEIGYWLVSDRQGNGFAQEASEKLVEFAFKTLNQHKIWGETITSNEASKQLMVKIGFREVGVLREEILKNGVWYDRVRLELLKKDWEKLEK